jgi:putative phosphoesterase
MARASRAPRRLAGSARRAPRGARRAATATVRTIGVISDTHGLVRPEALAALRCADLIVHAGDVGSPEVLARLREIAPVVAVRGNNDRGAWARRLPERVTLEVNGRRLHVLHDAKTLDLDPVAAGLDVVIAGHSHRPRIERRHGVLFLNPGSAGPRRFRLPVALARLRVDGSHFDAEIVELSVTEAPSDY